MNYRVICCMILCSISSLNALTHTNQTYITPRAIGTYYFLSEQPTERSLHATGWYHQSQNGTKIGQYFGKNRSNEIFLAPSTTITVPAHTVYTDQIIHNSTTDPTLKGTLSLAPKRTTYGVTLTYRQDITSRLFLRVHAPIAHIKHTLNVNGCTKTKETTNGMSADILDYFYGNIEQITATDLQEKLHAARFKDIQTISGIADIHISLGYTVHSNDHHDVQVNGFFTIPTGTKPTGCYLFEPTRGANKHWCLGAGVSSQNTVYTSGETIISVLTDLTTGYAFKNTQKRTLGVMDEEGDDLGWGHYWLGGENGKKGTFPLANVITRDVSVAPGLYGNGTVTLSLQHKKLLIDLGYHCFAREGEKITVKCWPENTYGVSDPDYDTTNAFTQANTIDEDGFITKERLNTQNAANPAILTHTLSLQTGFDWGRALTQIGAAYEFYAENALFQGYFLWAKAGISF